MTEVFATLWHCSTLNRVGIDAPADEALGRDPGHCHSLFPTKEINNERMGYPRTHPRHM